MVNFKESVLIACKSTLKKKMALISHDIREINESMLNETKSSVGDKHETARARMQSEHEKLSYMMVELQEQYNRLEKLDLTRPPDLITSENIVFTDKQIFFLAIPLGKVDVDGRTVFVISKESPLGKKLIGRKVNDTVGFNQVNYLIKDIL